jgi:peptidoglycan/LPS O-acetylase OafA/YrhL
MSVTALRRMGADVFLVGMDKPPEKRLLSLDGLRGWAALFVLASHLVCGVFVGLIPLSKMPVLDVVLDGHFAVFIFFVLSGFALTTKFVEKPATYSVMQAVAARYFRLAPPIAVVCVVAYLLLKAHLMFNLEAARLTRLPEWLGSFYTFDPSVSSLSKFSLYWVFFKYDLARSYNSNLWTMPIEFQGSMLVFSIVAVFVTPARRNFFTLPIAAAAGIFLLSAPSLACFIFGYVLAECYHSPLESNKLVQSAALAILPIVIGVKTLFPYERTIDTFDALLAAGMVFAVVFAPFYQRLFSSATSRFLGKISFPLYLVQIPLICSYSSFLFLRLGAQGMPAAKMAVIVIGSSMLLALLAAWLLLPVERFSIYFSGRAGAWLVRFFSIQKHESGASQAALSQSRTA